MYRMSSSGSAPDPAKMLNDVHHTSQNMLCIFSFMGLIIIIIIIIFNYPQEVKIPGLKTKIKNKLEWLRVGIVLNWESCERGLPRQHTQNIKHKSTTTKVLNNKII